MLKGSAIPAGWGLKGSAIPAGWGLSFALTSTFTPLSRELFLRVIFQIIPKDAARESGAEKFCGQRYLVLATLGVGLPRQSSPTPHGLSNNPTPPLHPQFSLFNFKLCLTEIDPGILNTQEYEKSPMLRA